MKAKKKYFKMLVIAAIFMLCIGCGKKSVDKQLVGKWQLEGGDDTVYVEFVFYEDGSYKRAKIHYGDEDVQVSGDYKVVSDEDIELTSTATGLGQDDFHIAGIHKFTLDGDTFTLQGGGGAGTYYRK